ncbi:MAG: SGNH/GDSL hydrolase family protein [Candidatus Eisenbacteria bacterium]
MPASSRQRSLPSARNTRIVSAVTSIAASMVLALALLEGACRLWVEPPPEPRRTVPPNAPQIRPLGGRMYAYEPKVEFAHVYDPGYDHRDYLGPESRIEYHINSAGFRGPSFAPIKPADVRRVLLLGDSVTFGEGVRYPDTMGARIETVLDSAWAPQRARVINAGVQGFDTEQEVALFHALRGLSPDVAVLVFFPNDAMQSSETIRWQLDASGAGRRTGLAPLPRVAALAGIRRRARLEHEYLAELKQAWPPGPSPPCRAALEEFANVTRENGCAASSLSPDALAAR